MVGLCLAHELFFQPQYLGQYLAQGKHTVNLCGLNKEKNGGLISKFTPESGAREALQPALTLVSDLLLHPLPHSPQLLSPYSSSFQALAPQELQARGQATGQSVLANSCWPAAGPDLVWSRSR